MPVSRVALSTFTYMWSLGRGGSRFDDSRPSMSLLDLCDRAVELGADAIQFADNRPLDGLPDGEVDTLLSWLESAGIAVEIGTRGLAAPKLLGQLALASRVGSPILRVVIDEAGAAPMTADDAIEALQPHRAAFEAAGVVLAIENHDHLPSTELARICRTLGGWTGICLDTVNSFGALEGPEHVIETLGPLTVNLHIKDFDVVRAEHAMGFAVEGRPAGEGRLDIPALVRDAFGGRSVTGVLELWTPPAATLGETRALEQDWARQSMNYLRGVLA